MFCLFFVFFFTYAHIDRTNQSVSSSPTVFLTAFLRKKHIP